MIRRALFLVAGVLALALSAAAPAAAQAVAGTWQLDVTLDAGNGRATFVFRVEGNVITGTYAGVLGDQEVTGTIEGNRARFGFNSPDAGAVRFDGMIEGNTMEGTCEYGQLGSGSFTGSRSS
jgi:polyisoprenoid-binding protein YceI